MELSHYLSEPDLSQLETLRLLAIARAIPLHPVDLAGAVTALVSARLWCALLSSTSLEFAPRYGNEFDASADAILRAAAGHRLEVPPYSAVAPTPRYSRHAIEVAESVLGAQADLLALTPGAPVLSGCLDVFAPLSHDERFAAALDVLEAHLV